MIKESYDQDSDYNDKIVDEEDLISEYTPLLSEELMNESFKDSLKYVTLVVAMLVSQIGLADTQYSQNENDNVNDSKSNAFVMQSVKDIQDKSVVRDSLQNAKKMNKWFNKSDKPQKEVTGVLQANKNLRQGIVRQIEKVADQLAREHGEDKNMLLNELTELVYQTYYAVDGNGASGRQVRVEYLNNLSQKKSNNLSEFEENIANSMYDAIQDYGNDKDRDQLDAGDKAMDDLWSTMNGDSNNSQNSQENK